MSARDWLRKPAGQVCKVNEFDCSLITYHAAIDSLKVLLRGSLMENKQNFFMKFQNALGENKESVECSYNLFSLIIRQLKVIEVKDSFQW